MNDRAYRVVTRYYAAPDYGSAYITVRLDNGKVRKIPYDYEADNAHQMAVRDAFARMGMIVDGIGFIGSARGGRGNVYHVTASEKG